MTLQRDHSASWQQSAEVPQGCSGQEQKHSFGLVVLSGRSWEKRDDTLHWVMEKVCLREISRSVGRVLDSASRVAQPPTISSTGITLAFWTQRGKRERVLQSPDRRALWTGAEASVEGGSKELHPDPWFFLLEMLPIGQIQPCSRALVQTAQPPGTHRHKGEGDSAGPSGSHLRVVPSLAFSETWTAVRCLSSSIKFLKY